MEIYRTPSKESQDILLASVVCSEVIEGLNRYFASEPRNNYISIWPTVNKRDFVLYEPEAWADILIEWLRKKHDIFYYPGMEVKHAKIERIPPLTERLMDEGALNSLKALHKRITGEDPAVSSHTLIADAIRCSVYEKESEIEELKADLKKAKMEKEKFLIEVADREEEIEELQNKDYDVYLEHRRYIINSIVNNIRQEASRNGFDLPKKIDGEPLSIERTFHDLLELLMKRTAEIKKVNDQRWNDLRDINKALGCDGMDGHVDDFAKAVKARAECTKRALGEESDINKLIRDYCTKHDIVAPSRYFSDKACVEYLFSIINSKQKDCSFAILQDLYRDIFKRQPDGLSAEDIANKILDRVLETEDLLHKSVDSVNKECKAVGKQMVDDYEKDLLKFIYKEYGNRIHLSDETITYDPPSVRNTVLKIISDYARCRIRVDILETRIKSIFDKGKTKFTVDDYVLEGDPTTMFMLDYISSWIGSPAESRGKTRAEIENYKLKLKDYILHGIKKRGYRYDGLEKKSIEDIVDWIITMATCANKSDISDRIHEICTAKGVELDDAFLYDDGYTWEDLVGFLCEEIRKLKKEVEDTQKETKRKCDWYLWRANKAEEEVKKLNDVIKKQKELLNEINKEEENE